MRKGRFFCESISEYCTLDPVESNHIGRVLRLTEGTPVELFDGQGTCAGGVIENISRKQVTIHATDINVTAPPSSGRIVLAVSFAKGQRFDWLVEKCTELGVDHIAAVQFERTVKLGKTSAMERYRKITIGAAKQSGRNFLPKISGPEKFPASISLLKCEYPQSVIIYGDPTGNLFSSLQPDLSANDVIIVVGPEGGLCEHETALLKSEECAGVSINRNILRIETAAVAFCSLISSLRCQ